MLEAGKWVKSSFSNGSGGNNCVEVIDRGSSIGVRNSLSGFASVHFTRDEWRAFIDGVHAGEFDIEDE